MLPPRVDEATRLAARWVKQLTDDWSVVKAEILGELDNEHRALFSRRDARTKELPPPNDLEREVIALWESVTGVSLVQRPLAERRTLVWWDPEEAERIKHRSGRPPKKREDVGW